MLPADMPWPSAPTKQNFWREKLIASLAMDEYFAAIIGSDTPEKSKNLTPVISGERSRRLVPLATRAIMVGDSENDIISAQAANIPVIAVDFGYSTRARRKL